MNQYASFTNQIPVGVLGKTEKHYCCNTALFKPELYLGGFAFTAEDYHVIIPSESPPATYVNRKPVMMFGRGVFIVNPGDTVICTKNAETKRYYSLLLKPRLLRQVAGEMGFSGDIRFLQAFNPVSTELLQAVNAFDRESCRSDRIKLMLDSLEVQIAAALLRDFRSNAEKEEVPPPDSDSYVRMAAEYMRAYYSADITIGDICGEIHVSPFHFIRMFKQKTGMTPHQFLLRVRIEKARELLQSGRYSISEAASACGFISIPHFYEKFKEITGASPGSCKM